MRPQLLFSNLLEDDNSQAERVGEHAKAVEFVLRAANVKHRSDRQQEEVKIRALLFVSGQISQLRHGIGKVNLEDIFVADLGPHMMLRMDFFECSVLSIFGDSSRFEPSRALYTPVLASSSTHHTESPHHAIIVQHQRGVTDKKGT